MDALEDKEAINLVGVAECLVNWEKAIEKWGFGYVDDKNAITRTLVSLVVSKCHPLLIKLYPEGENSYWKHGHGNGGFIRWEAKQKQSSPGGSTVTRTLYSVYPITAKHNLRTITHETFGKFIPASPTFDVADNGVPVDWVELGWTPDHSVHVRFDLREGTHAESRPAFCEFGFDISVGPCIDHYQNPSCLPAHSFARVRKNLKIAKGMKVGIAVSFTEKTRPRRDTIVGIEGTTAPSNFSEDEIAKYYGQPGQVNIYTGKILYVGPKHIEYDINAFTSCSGSIVFLLDVDQPSSVEGSDHGTAVAIHSGAHPSLADRNYGFLINEHPVFANP